VLTVELQQQVAASTAALQQQAAQKTTLFCFFMVFSFKIISQKS